jgi:regulator of protease activity HflC (stomatin/prohibitin superfamily)
MMSFSADADIGLLNGDITAALDVALKPGEEVLAGAEPSVSFDWEGPLAQPARNFDVTALNGFLSLRRFEQERRRVEIMQANIAEKQRLRREAALYRSLAAERERLQQQARDNERLLKEAQDALKALARAEEEARRKAQAEADKQAPVDRQDSNGVQTLDLSPDVLNQ